MKIALITFLIAACVPSHSGPQSVRLDTLQGDCGDFTGDIPLYDGIVRLHEGMTLDCAITDASYDGDIYMEAVHCTGAQLIYVYSADMDSDGIGTLRLDAWESSGRYCSGLYDAYWREQAY